MATEEDPTLVMLQSLSHPLRKMILEILDSRSNATFTELLFLCGLDAYYQKGLLDYHLKNLSDAGIVTKVNNHYALSGIGRKITEFFNAVNQEYKNFASKERKVENGQKVSEEMKMKGEKKVPKIVIKELPETSLVIDSFIFPVGEKRKYHTKMFPSESPFRDYDEIEECLEETAERNGKFKVMQRTFSEPAGWCKLCKITRKNGVYILRAITWEEKDKTEVEDIYDPPWVYERFPLKAGLKGREGPLHESSWDKEITAVTEWEVMGDYDIKIGRDIRRCLLKRSVITYFLNNSVHPDAPQFVTDTYYAKGLLKVLSRRWDKLDWMKKVGYKNWEKSPTLKYSNQVWYLTDETYLAEITNS